MGSKALRMMPQSTFAPLFHIASLSNRASEFSPSLTDFLSLLSEAVTAELDKSIF